ncbi:hypothetical protein [Stenotrophomonas forensis]
MRVDSADSRSLPVSSMPLSRPFRASRQAGCSMLNIVPDPVSGWTVKDTRPKEAVTINHIVVDSGGEAIPSNTYGMEIEFCTHDSEVFAFTHVVAARFKPGQIFRKNDEKVNLGQSGAWVIESDSDNTFELVSPPLRFDTIRSAYAFKAKLVQALRDSVSVTLPPQNVDMQLEDVAVDDAPPIVACLFSDWQERFRPRLHNLLSEAAQSGKLELDLLPDNGPALVPPSWEYASWGDVGDEINVYNVDDGINIPAGRYRHSLQRADWPDYTRQIILAKYSKFWSSGFSSQMNLPMTLSGYYLYMLRKTAMPQYTALVNGHDPHPCITERDNRKLNLWYWRHVLLRACCLYIVRVDNLDQNDAFNPVNLPRCAVLYLVSSKLLTGALASISEPLQLEMQRAAWDASSTQAIDADQGATMTEAQRDWAPYHSGLKDLTGIWLKASLMDVLRTQDLAVYQWAVLNLPNVLLDQSIWRDAFKDWDVLNALEPLRDRADVDWNDLDYFRRRGPRARLCDRIHAASQQLAEYLFDLGHDQPVMPGDVDLPPQSERRFLERDGVPAWEARYDTLYRPIVTDAKGKPVQPARYLIEHRNN